MNLLALTVAVALLAVGTWAEEEKAKKSSMTFGDGWGGKRSSMTFGEGWGGKKRSSMTFGDGWGGKRSSMTFGDGWGGKRSAGGQAEGHGSCLDVHQARLRVVQELIEQSNEDLQSCMAEPKAAAAKPNLPWHPKAKAADDKH